MKRCFSEMELMLLQLTHVTTSNCSTCRIRFISQHVRSDLTWSLAARFVPSTWTT